MPASPFVCRRAKANAAGRKVPFVVSNPAILSGFPVAFFAGEMLPPAANALQPPHFTAADFGDVIQRPKRAPESVVRSVAVTGAQAEKTSGFTSNPVRDALIASVTAVQAYKLKENSE
ncbi:MAG: hypothetical protein R3D60_07090 [Paracoccaceae bacterium]